MDKKKCTKCEEVKTIELFRVGRNQCKKCLSVLKKKWVESNKDHIREYNIRNPRVQNEKDKERKRYWYLNNKERLTAANKAWIKNNPRMKAVYSKKWAQANKGAVNHLGSKYRSKKLRSTPSWYDNESVKSIYDLSAFLSFATFGKGYHVDHIIPLRSDIVCGLHAQENLQILRAEDNMDKSNRHWPDMPDAKSESQEILL